MANLTTAIVIDAECFYCNMPIDYGSKVYENEGAYAHIECYEGESLDAAVSLDDNDTEGPDGGDDE